MKAAALDVSSLYTDLAPRLRRQVGLPREVVDDLVQETFIRLLTKPPARASNLSAWLFRVFSNLVTDYHRAQKPDAGPLSDQIPVRETYEVTEAEMVISGWLRGHLKELPPIYAEAVRLADFEGKNMRTVADAIGLSISGAKSRVQRGRHKLYRALSDCCHIERDDRGRAVGYQRRTQPPEGCTSCG